MNFCSKPYFLHLIPVAVIGTWNKRTKFFYWKILNNKFWLLFSITFCLSGSVMHQCHNSGITERRTIQNLQLSQPVTRLSVIPSTVRCLTQIVTLRHITRRLVNGMIHLKTAMAIQVLIAKCEQQLPSQQKFIVNPPSLKLGATRLMKYLSWLENSKKSLDMLPLSFNCKGKRR